MIFAPSLANSSAHSRPSPDPDPVIATTLSCRRICQTPCGSVGKGPDPSTIKDNDLSEQSNRRTPEIQYTQSDERDRRLRTPAYRSTRMVRGDHPEGVARAAARRR